MARFDPILAWLGDGTPMTLRHAERRDARALVALTRRVLATAPYMVREEAEYDVSPRDEKAWIQRQQDDPYGLYLVAEAQGQLAGLADCRGETRRRRRHAVTLGLAIDPAWQGRGIGRALTRQVLDWARGHPDIGRVELNVHAANTPALALYRSLGFIEEGRRRAALKYDDGHYQDDMLMCAFVGGSGAGDR